LIAVMLLPLQGANSRDYKLKKVGGEGVKSPAFAGLNQNLSVGPMGSYKIGC